MIYELFQKLTEQVANIEIIFLVVNAVLHFIFASAVAKDAGNLSKLNQRPLLVSGLSWAFATLVGGVCIAAIYWLIHHSKLTVK